MSETQKEYETGHETDAEPTPGPWFVESFTVFTKYTENSGPRVCSVTGYARRDQSTQEANARLIAAAGTAAQEVKEMGYDPVAVQKALSEILKAAGALVESAEGEIGEAAFASSPPKLLESPSRETIDALKSALASAEGSEK